MSEDARVEAAARAIYESDTIRNFGHRLSAWEEVDERIKVVSRQDATAALAAADAVPEPIAPDNTAERDRLETIVGKAVNGILPKNVTIRAEAIGYTAITAYLEAVRGTVVSTDDLRMVLTGLERGVPMKERIEANDRLRAKLEETT